MTDFAVLQKDENGMDWFDHRYKHTVGSNRRKVYADIERRQFIADMKRADERRACTPGQQCQDINRLCSKHSMEYQTEFGRASNE
jgi:hypothetical protein